MRTEMRQWECGTDGREEADERAGGQVTTSVLGKGRSIGRGRSVDLGIVTEKQV